VSKSLPFEAQSAFLLHSWTTAGAAPLASRAEEGEVLVVHLDVPAARAGETPAPQAILRQIAPVLHQAIDTVRRRSRQQRRLRRLEAILEIVSQWNQTSELEPLLVQMAEAAARLLEADRASIFLWDRPNHTLVGRPALGLPDGELRIRDDRGVVGEVIRTGEPRRVDAAKAGRKSYQLRRSARLILAGRPWPLLPLTLTAII